MIDRMQNYVRKESDYQLALSRAFIGSLDRSALDDFAVDLESLIAINAREAYSVTHKELSDVQIDVYQALSGYASKAMSMKELARTTVTSELFFWWSRTDDDDLIRGARSNSFYRDQFAVFNLIADSGVKAHPYFHAGIWDINVVRHCIENDIDTTLALSMGLGTGKIFGEATYRLKDLVAA